MLDSYTIELISSYLTPTDAVNFSKVCKDIYFPFSSDRTEYIKLNMKDMYSRMVPFSKIKIEYIPFYMDVILEEREEKKKIFDLKFNLLRKIGNHLNYNDYVSDRVVDLEDEVHYLEDEIYKDLVDIEDEIREIGTRIYQSMEVDVNSELEEIEEVLNKAREVTKESVSLYNKALQIYPFQSASLIEIDENELYEDDFKTYLYKYRSFNFDFKEKINKLLEDLDMSYEKFTLIISYFSPKMYLDFFKHIQEVLASKFVEAEENGDFFPSCMPYKNRAAYNVFFLLTGMVAPTLVEFKEYDIELTYKEYKEIYKKGIKNLWPESIGSLICFLHSEARYRKEFSQILRFSQLQKIKKSMYIKIAYNTLLSRYQYVADFLFELRPDLRECVMDRFEKRTKGRKPSKKIKKLMM